MKTLHFFVMTKQLSQTVNKALNNSYKKEIV